MNTKSTHLYLVRHAESEWNVEGRFCGSSDCALTTVGRFQAKALGAWLAAMRPAAVYASPLSRAQETARPLAEALGIDVRTRRALRERDYGAWEGMRFDEIRAAWPEELARFKDDPSTVIPPGGESCHAVARRFARGLRALARVHEGETIAVVAHQTALRIFLAPLLRIPLTDYYRSEALRLANSAASLVRFDPDGAATVVWVNRTSHLGPC